MYIRIWIWKYIKNCANKMSAQQTPHRTNLPSDDKFVEDAVYACLNTEESPVPDEIRDRSIVICGDSSRVIQELIS